MNCRNYLPLVLQAALLAACTAAEEPPQASLPAAETARTEFLREGAQEVSVFAFREQNGVFRYDTLYRDGWSPEGRMSVRMPYGRYKFLFVSGASAFAQEPSPLTRLTAWEEVAFRLREDAASEGTFLPAGELFLQYPAAAADSVYTLGNAGGTVGAKLSRAVCQIGIALKRGYRDGDGYMEVPYEKPRNILDDIARVEVRAASSGLRVSPAGSSGSAVVTASLDASACRELTEEGFVLLDGPFLLPPADGGELQLELDVTPAEGSPLAPKQLRLAGEAGRNERLEVTLWVTAGYPEIGVEIRVAPIGRTQEGDTGIWE